MELEAYSSNFHIYSSMRFKITWTRNTMRFFITTRIYKLPTEIYPPRRILKVKLLFTAAVTVDVVTLLRPSFQPWVFEAGLMPFTRCNEHLAGTLFNKLFSDSVNCAACTLYSACSRSWISFDPPRIPSTLTWVRRMPVRLAPACFTSFQTEGARGLLYRPDREFKSEPFDFRKVTACGGTCSILFSWFYMIISASSRKCYYQLFEFHSGVLYRQSCVCRRTIWTLANLHKRE